MKSLEQRDFSAQEVMHDLLSLKLVSSSFYVVPISLNGSRKVKTTSGNEDVVTDDSLLDVYAKRAMYAEKIPDIITLNFIAFATKYELVSNKLTAHAQNIVPRIFPVYSSNNKGPNLPLCCKFHLLRYKPWNTTQENVWGDKPGTDRIYISKWKEFLQISYAKEYVPDWHDNMDISYSVISRVKILSSCIIEPMTFEILTSLKKSPGLQHRLQEESTLDKFAALLDENQPESYST